jgi:DNA-binding transcriptional ArsR family regulator
MGTSKTEVYDQNTLRLSKIAKALAHPARIAILEVLIRRQACICGDIVDELPLSQSTVSQHLKELKEAGIIKGDIEGVRVCYCIDPEVWSASREMLNTFFGSAELPTQCCS